MWDYRKKLVTKSPIRQSQVRPKHYFLLTEKQRNRGKNTTQKIYFRIKTKQKGQERNMKKHKEKEIETGGTRFTAQKSQPGAR